MIFEAKLTIDNFNFYIVNTQLKIQPDMAL